ncbi:hypothetical protein LJK88_02750 [Paenibacillus sp. P26]|nr:hypothetical protein LJK88_02750 [Paenibacillus sp. P26]
MSEFPPATGGQTPKASPDDVQANKWIAAIAYILFFLPLAAKDSRFAMYHANQGLLLLLTVIASNIVLGLIPFLGLFLVPIANLGLLVLTIIGILNAASGFMKPAAGHRHVPDHHQGPLRNELPGEPGKRLRIIAKKDRPASVRVGCGRAIFLLQYELRIVNS